MRRGGMTIHCLLQSRRQHGRNRLRAVNYGAGLIMAGDKRRHTELDALILRNFDMPKAAYFGGYRSVETRSDRQNLLCTSVFCQALTGLCQQDTDTIRFLHWWLVTPFS